jgi:hypothetical protein
MMPTDSWAPFLPAFSRHHRIILLVMMPWEQKGILEGIPEAGFITLPRTVHVLFLERPELFASLAMGWFGCREPIDSP